MNDSNSHPSPETDASPADPLDWGSALAIHDRWLRRLVASGLGEPQAVEEVMQDVALAAVAQRSPLQDPARVAVWLYRLAVRHVLIYRRKSGRRRSFFDRYANQNASPDIDRAPSPLTWLVRDERDQLVQQALTRLPPRDAQILILKHAEGSSARDIADRLGVTISTIEARLHRARQKLRVELAQLASEFEATDHDQP